MSTHAKSPAQFVAVPEQSNMAPESNKDIASLMVFLITLALLSFNYYHAYTYWSAKLYNPVADNYIFATIMPVLFSVIAFIEIPLTVLFYNAMRLRDGILFRFFYFILLVTVVIATTMMGSSSQNGFDDKLDNSVSSYEQKLKNLDAQMQAAKSKRDATIALAETKDSTKKAMFTANAEAVYQRKLVNIGGQKAKLLESKPVQQSHGSGVFSMSDDTFNLFWAAFLSLMGIALTIYKIDYVQAVMRIPVVSLKNKLDHDWNSHKDDFQNRKHSISPVKNILTLGSLARAKSTSNITPLPDNSSTNTSPEDSPQKTAKPTDNQQQQPAEKNPSPTAEYKGKEIFFNDDGYVFSEQSVNGKIVLRIYDQNRKNIIFQLKSAKPKPTEMMIDHPSNPISQKFFKVVKEHYGIDLNPVKSTGEHPSPRLGGDAQKNTANTDREGRDAPRNPSNEPSNQDALGTHPKIDMDAMKGRWIKAENEKTGGMIDCVFCGEETPKRTDTKRHCSPKCRKSFSKLSDQKKAFLAEKQEEQGSDSDGKRKVKSGETIQLNMTAESIKKGRGK